MSIKSSSPISSSKSISSSSSSIDSKSSSPNSSGRSTSISSSSPRSRSISSSSPSSPISVSSSRSSSSSSPCSLISSVSPPKDSFTKDLISSFITEASIPFVFFAIDSSKFFNCKSVSSNKISFLLIFYLSRFIFLNKYTHL